MQKPTGNKTVEDEKMSSEYFSDDEYWTRKGRIQHTAAGKFRESVKKSLNLVRESELSYHAYRKQIGTD